MNAAAQAAPPMQPLGDRLLIKPLEATERMVGKVIVPDLAQEKPQQGIVIASGPDVGLRLQTNVILSADGSIGRTETGHFRSTTVSPGDRVLYTKYAGSEITIDDVGYLVLKEADCLGILPPISEDEADCVGTGTQKADDTEL